MLVKRKLQAYPHDPAKLFLQHIEFASEFGPLRELSLASAEMPLYEYYNLDVLALMLAMLVAGFALTQRLIFAILFIIRYGKKKTE